jgi:hypothetical protein
LKILPAAEQALVAALAGEAVRNLPTYAVARDAVARFQKEWEAAFPNGIEQSLLTVAQAAAGAKIGGFAAEEHDATAADMDAVLESLDQGIAAEQIAMDRLLERMAPRTPQ